LKIHFIIRIKDKKMALSKITKSLFLIAGVCQIENGISGTNAITLKRMINAPRCGSPSKPQSLLARGQNVQQLENMIEGVRMSKDGLPEPANEISSLESKIKALLKHKVT
jgi:hypothetical protein